MSKSDKDWYGTQESLFRTLGASNHTDKGKCCKRCNALNCNSRQCVNPQAIKRAQRDKLPWYLKDEILKM